MGGRRWTTSEDAIIRSMYGTAFAREIADKIDRSENSVWVRARTLGLDKRPTVTPWTDDELDELRRCYSTEKPTDLALRLRRTPSSVYQQARYLGLLSHKTLAGQSVVIDYFDAIDSAEKAYILGLFAADGNVMDNGRITFGLQTKDADIVRLIRDRIAPEISLHTDPNRAFVSFSVVSRPLAAGLAQWGVVPRKSRTLGWPFTIGDDMLRPFLLGYFDGDGCIFVIRQRYPGWSVASGSRQFLADMKEYVRISTGVTMEKIQQRRGAELYQVSTTGTGAYLVDKWIHQDGLGFARKCLPEHIVVRYRTPPRPEKSNINGIPTWAYSPALRKRATELLRERRRAEGIRYGDVTEVARHIGVPPYALRYWAKQDKQR